VQAWQYSGGKKNGRNDGQIMQTNENGWDESAAAWIAELGDLGDFGRRFVLDQPMEERVRLRAPASALDVGCGEGRFCRMLQPLGIRTVGIDPTEALVARAIALDPTGDYRVGMAERLDFEDQCFDLVVSYLSLIDIAQLGTALAEMARVLRPGGSLLVANLTGFTTAGMVFGGRRPRGADKHAGYLDEHSSQVSWGNIRIRNWHRPLETYMKGFLEVGLQLRHFSEPRPHGGPPEKVRRYLKAPYFLIMEWTKPR
jgi:SAM-dependent methyltransferase